MSARGQQAALDIDQEFNNTLRLLNKQQCEEEMEALLQGLTTHPRTYSPDIDLKMAGYFDASAEATEICVALLRNIKSFLASMSTDLTASTGAGAGLALNPFCTTRSNFRQIHDKYTSMFRSIRSSHKKVARKLKVMKAIKKLLKIGLVVACGAAAVGAVAAAAHLLFFGLMVGPAAAGLCPIALRKRMTKKTRSSKTGSLLRLREQLDTAAKGAYVLGNDLDTVTQLVARLSDGIERENAMSQYCVEREREGSSVPEMVSELKKSYSNSRMLALELEEHVCLCLATIDRARVLVIQEISKQA
ncbi:hypothetical protein EJB05_38008, partial [Eragrostis curvula]